MRRIATLLFGAILFLVASPQVIHATEMDSDWPSGLAFFVEDVVSGNPLDRGDVIYGVRGTYRLPSGDLGLELGIGHARPTSDFVTALGDDAGLLLVDLSVVWYPAYRRYYAKAMNSDPWHQNKTFKSELVVFGGPGWALLKIDDAFPGSSLSGAEDYFTINGGVGVEIHRMQTDKARGWDHRTSRWYVRPEVRGRWFAGGSGEVDWSVGLSLGTRFGHRPTEQALRLKADVTRRRAQEVVDEVEPNSDTRSLGSEKLDALWSRGMDARGTLEELKAYATSCRHRCADVREQLDDAIRELNDALAKLRPGER